MLNQLLTRSAQYAPNFGAGLANHLPMALIALARLGADDTRLEAYFNEYIKQLSPVAASPGVIDPAFWQRELGQLAYYAAYRDYFAAQLAAEGVDAVVRRHIHDLLPGIGGAAFHGVIRAQYALASGNLDEIACGLAYWACSARKLADWPVPMPAPQSADPLTLVTRLFTPAFAIDPAAFMISARMRSAVQLPAFAEVVGWLDVQPDTLQKLAVYAAECYVVTGDFTVLHLVTSAHALRGLARWIDDMDTAVRWYWQAYAAGVIASGIAGPAPHVTVPAQPDWAPLIAAGIAAADEHVIKLIDACHEEYAAYGEGAHVLAARRIAQR
ncbi:questin oxidase family protein [Silvimonas iriomotensis]|uniref:Questin oxidase family protein n=1 Tax=Silvimonas iriomotensis TaxID=449662 RepID=A0ABQ2P3P7_9NEIS|nr:questin oxidase family protein [Silvimonas iriomotensis]GGP17633.1 hypothetical protein GCM10010970_00710 [Silvimonas iriomotensis]